MCVRRKMCADLPAAGMRAKRRKLEAQAVALQPEVELADPTEAQAIALQPEADLAVLEQNKRSRVQKDCCLL